MKIRKFYLLVIPFLLLFKLNHSTCQEGNPNPAPTAESITVAKKAKNIVLMIGDGMGTAQVYTAIIVKPDGSNFERFPITGFSKTYSADDLITDSAAGGTAMATGEKTNNGMIGISPDKVPVKNIVEIAEKNGKSTGLVATSIITHATPASFIAHVESRSDYEKIALAFLETDIDVFIGGGSVNFTHRLDRRNLAKELTKKGYSICQSMEELNACTGDKIAGLVYESDPPSVINGRGNMLMEATKKALEVLSKNDKGFFLMVESSQIDWGNHQNNIKYQTMEVMDFDNVIGEVLKFAEKDGETLVIVTGDHETGGLGINGGKMGSGLIEPGFTTLGHTGVMVPVFAYGPQAELFSGIYDNTEIFHKMLEASNQK